VSIIAPCHPASLGSWTGTANSKPGEPRSLATGPSPRGHNQGVVHTRPWYKESALLFMGKVNEKDPLLALRFRPALKSSVSEGSGHFAADNDHGTLAAGCSHAIRQEMPGLVLCRRSHPYMPDETMAGSILMRVVWFEADWKWAGLVLITPEMCVRTATHR
jgi:hypothetical protein